MLSVFCFMAAKQAAGFLEGSGSWLKSIFSLEFLVKFGWDMCLYGDVWFEVRFSHATPTLATAAAAKSSATLLPQPATH